MLGIIILSPYRVYFLLLSVGILAAFLWPGLYRPQQNTRWNVGCGLLFYEHVHPFARDQDREYQYDVRSTLR